MSEFFRWLFPPEFWRTTIQVLMVALLVFGADLMAGSKLMHWLSRTMNKRFHIDHLVINLLAKIKQGSDFEFNMESALLKGLGRFACGAILFACVFLMYTQLLPRLR